MDTHVQTFGDGGWHVKEGRPSRSVAILNDNIIRRESLANEVGRVLQEINGAKDRNIYWEHIKPAIPFWIMQKGEFRRGMKVQYDIEINFRIKQQELRSTEREIY